MDINIYTPSFVLIGILDSYKSLLWIDRYLEVGEVELETSPSPNNLSLLRPDNFMSIRYSDIYMIIDSMEIKSDVEDGDKLIIRGRPISSILDRRIVWAQTTLSGSFQTELNRLLTENVISPTLSKRTISGFSFVSSSDAYITAATINEQFHGQNLLEVIQAICYARTIGFKVVVNNGAMEFKLYYGANRSFTQTTNVQVIFSPEFDNLIKSDYIYNVSGEKTATLVLGEGEGSDRKTIEVDLIPSYTGIFRKECGTEAKNLSSKTTGGTLTLEQYNNLLTDRGLIELSEKTAFENFGAEVDASVGFVYGTHFFLGDIVEVTNEYGITGAMRVTEITVSEDSAGFRIFPTFEMV